MPPSISRLERFDVVGSTNDVVRRWLADGTPEVCVAIADEQTAGRGRDGRAWLAPPGSALLLSLGFRPVWLAADRLWRLAAVVSLAMAEAGEAMTGVAGGTIRLKWPNDLVVDTPDGGEAIAIHPVGNLAMAWDHRAFDGAYAANFLARIKEILETKDWDGEL